jgi:hypothetical protein
LAPGCVTVSENGLYKEFRGFGFSRKQANCLVASLEQDLSRDELGELAERARWVRNETGQRDAIYALMRGVDRRTKGALADAGNDCLDEDK